MLFVAELASFSDPRRLNFVLNVDDVELDRTYEDRFDPPEIPPSRIGWVIGAFVVLAIAAGLGYYIFFTQPRPAPAKPTLKAVTAPPAATEPVAPPAPALAPENIALPPLPQTDPIVRELIGRLSSHPSIAAWLATKGLIANFTVVTLNVADGQAPATHLRAIAPRGRFQTTQAGAALTIDPRSYSRYNGYAEAISQLDATGAARLYLTLKPRIAEAYRELGYPDGDFDRVLERAMGQLLRVPVVEGRVALRPKTLSFAYAEPRLESLTPAQKQFLRMGPDNVQVVQAKLREIAALLSLNPEPTH